MTYSAMTYSAMTYSAMTYSTMTYSAMTYWTHPSQLALILLTPLHSHSSPSHPLTRHTSLITPHTIITRHTSLIPPDTLTPPGVDFCPGGGR